MLRFANRIKHQKGQALVEFLMLMPIVMALLWYMIQVNMAINVSVVNQKHLRTWLFQKMFNHSGGPADGAGIKDFESEKRSAFYIGVTKDPFQDTGKPDAPVIKLGTGTNPDAIDDPDEIPLDKLRQNVRIRSAIGICTHRKTIPNTSPPDATDYCEGGTP